MTFYNYETPMSSYESDAMAWSVVLGVVALIYLLIFAYAVVSYIFKSISLYKIAQRRGVESPILAWIPVASSWLTGKIAEHTDASGGKKSKWGVTLLILNLLPVAIMVLTYVIVFISVISAAFTYGVTEGVGYGGEAEGVMLIISIFVPIFIFAFLAEMATLAHYAIDSICIYKIFESCNPKTALRNLLLYLLVPFAAPFVLFSCRNMDYGMPCAPQMIAPVAEKTTNEAL